VDPLERILAFQRGNVELVADSVREIDEGWVVETPSLPLVWSLNHLRLAQPVSYEQALSLCAAHHPRSRHLHVHIEDDATGQALAEGFRADGWEVEVNLHLMLVRDPDGSSDGQIEIVEPGEDEAVELMERWFGEDDTFDITPGGMRQLLDYNTLTWRARDARRFGVRLPGGELAVTTVLFSDGSMAQVEDVYAIPEARGHGYGRALVTRATWAAVEAGHELVFIVADDEDWPKELYKKVGFEPVGRSWLFHRKAPIARRR
jgi:GNAT superfamily N-acetyltransferase